MKDGKKPYTVRQVSFNRLTASGPSQRSRSGSLTSSNIIPRQQRTNSLVGTSLSDNDNKEWKINNARRRTLAALPKPSQEMLDRFPAIGRTWSSDSKPKVQDLCEEGRIIVKDYVYSRLRRSKLVRDELVRGYALKQTEVSLIFQRLGHFMEVQHSGLFASISRQVHKTMCSPAIVEKTLLAVAWNLFRKNRSYIDFQPTDFWEPTVNEREITWGKLVALLAVSGSLAEDCVTEGHPEFLPLILDSFMAITEYILSPWLEAHQGWKGIQWEMKKEQHVTRFILYMVFSFGLVASLLILSLLYTSVT